MAAPNAEPTTTVSPPERSSNLQLAGQAVTAGAANEIEFPITDNAALKTVKDSYGEPSTKAKMLLVLPNDFDPVGKICPLLIVSATTDGGGSSIGSGKANYLPDATNKGYAVMAVDGEFGKPPSDGDSTDFRWALVSSGLSAINKEWPQSKSWPIVTAGVSGGGGYASHQVMMLVQKQAPRRNQAGFQESPLRTLRRRPPTISPAPTDRPRLVSRRERKDEGRDA